jgi:hypothetical protein
MVFKYKVPRRGARVAPPPRLKAEKEPEVMGLINGRVPDSIEEWRVYKAIKRMGLPFRYQIPMGGGRDQRGGVVLDFLVWNPLAIPLPVNGDYWHSTDERIEMAVIANFLKVSIQYVEDHIIWGSEIPTQEDAYRVVRERAR